jgi:hypothetical protein
MLPGPGQQVPGRHENAFRGTSVNVRRSIGPSKIVGPAIALSLSSSCSSAKRASFMWLNSFVVFTAPILCVDHLQFARQGTCPANLLQVYAADLQGA